MVEIREPGGHGNRNGPFLVRAAEACRPVRRPRTVTLAAEGGRVVWPPDGPPALVMSLWGPVWDRLDGSLTGRDLVDDLIDVLGCSRDDAEQEVTRFVERLAEGRLAEGLGPWAEALSALRGADQPDDWYEGVRDGVRFISREVSIPMRQFRDLTGGHASRAELAPPDSCVGERLHLHREGHLRTVELDGLLLTVRSDDASRLRWLDGIDQIRQGEKGPIVAFVTSGPAGAGGTRWEVYDAGGVVAASTTDPSEVDRAVAGTLTSYGHGPTPSGHVRTELRAVVRGDRAVLASLGATQRPRGILRQLARHGVAVLPASMVWLADSGTSVVVPEPVVGGPYDGSRRFGRFEVVGLWAAANRPQDPTEAEIVSLFASDTDGSDDDERARTMGALQAASRRLPLACAYRGERSAPLLARRLAGMFET